MEIAVGEGAKVSHSGIQSRYLGAIHISPAAFHKTFADPFKGSANESTSTYELVEESTSTYELVEVSTGGKLSRHNVLVRHVQQTDAGQLTRSRILEPRASVNAKPNLPIIADDVKCSHGAAISDLEESQLFYFR
ncbi:hypothetical protein RJ639_024632 [Escallonia herrerae]|uniref:SUF system FeS cluster assembly SufBD core domain-containing protein n=1 Tax=Escallonia herrerae TaxID=1293975 RepID=A0AA89AD60_9ASTE|nr:hypothetical protein RJ639_024632 [Escallonia herrerae]